MTLTLTESIIILNLQGIRIRSISLDVYMQLDMNLYKVLLKTAVCSFFVVKNDPKYIFEKIHN